jgi:hypothetical protein
LNDFPQYYEIVDKLPVSVEQVYLEYNNINTLSNLEYLKLELPKLERLFIMGNNMTEEYLQEEAKKWEPVELIWWDNR